MTQKSPRYRIIKFYDSDGDVCFCAQKHIFGIWIGCRWYDGSYGPKSCFLEIVEKYVERKLLPPERKKEIVRIYD